MAEKTNVPEIRFAGFTDPWEQRKFSDLTDRISIQSSDSDLPQVEYEDIIPGEGTLNKELRDKEGGKTGIKFYAGDVLYGKLRPYLMNYLYPQFNGVAVGDFWVLRAAECDSSFLYRLVQTGSFQRLANVSSGSKMPRADWNLISQSFFAVPANHAEQKAIAKSLADLDNLITLHQRKYDKLCAVKKSMLDKMFPKPGETEPEIRFAGFTDPWEQRKLGELGVISTGNTPSTSCPDYYSDTGIPWVTPTDICESTQLVTDKSLSELGQTVARTVPSNSILCTCIASIGKNAITSTTSGFNQQINALVPDTNLYEPYFLYVQSSLWSETMKRNAAAGAMQIVNKSEFSDLITSIPSKDEQCDIASLFFRLDSLITLHQRKLNLLKNTKKSLLDRMFV